MKCRLDGPAPSDVAQHQRSFGSSQVTSTPFCAQVQKEYSRVFGSAKGGSRTALPRRVLPRDGDKPGLNCLKRKRQEQIATLSAASAALSPEAAAEVAELETTAAKESRKRLTEKQDKLAARLEAYAAKRRRAMIEDGKETDAATAAKLRDQLAAEEKELKRLRETEKRGFALNLRKDPLPFGTCVIATKADDNNELSNLGANFMVWPSSGEDCAALCKDLLSSATQLVWLCSTSREEQDMMFRPATSTTFTVAAVLIGGQIAGPEWRSLVVREKRLIPCIVSMARGLSHPRTVCFHRSLEGSVDPSAKALSIAYAAAKARGSVTWNVLAKWKHMWLGYAKCVFFGSFLMLEVAHVISQCCKKVK